MRSTTVKSAATTTKKSAHRASSEIALAAAHTKKSALSGGPERNTSIFIRTFINTVSVLGFFYLDCSFGDADVLSPGRIPGD